MSSAQTLWNTLKPALRVKLLREAYPARSGELLGFQSKLPWQKLLPSTQRELYTVNWPAVLDQPRTA